MVSNQWQIATSYTLPDWFILLLQSYTGKQNSSYLAQILWQRGIRQEQEVKQFLDNDSYQPTSPFVFGQEMKRAIKRLLTARNNQEKIAIWGDFDADGVTATSVLWEGLGQFFHQESQLVYYIPNRLRESHGLNCQGIDKLAQQGINLIVTCDTGSTNLREIDYAHQVGIELIITDHHTLPDERPPVISLLNPRYFGENHPLYHLAGVAVAYKLVEALYQQCPQIPQQPLEHLLDLVAIGLVADLVELKGDCRYLAKEGIKHLAKTKRFGLKKLLDLCKQKGDRPMDISFGIGPRINAVSRIKGDASFCVELLTTKDEKKAHQLAFLAEDANTNRKEIQNRVLKQAKTKLKYLDLSTTAVIVLIDHQWESGVLGLVANSLTQEYGRPTILLTTNTTDKDDSPIIARGSARSIKQIDLYELVASQQNLLSSFGGHPFAAGLALPLENLLLFQEGINQQLKTKLDVSLLHPVIEIDLVVTVAQLGRDLFKELKLIEPFGMGNPQPKLLLKNCWFTEIKNSNLTNRKHKKIKYIKTEFELWDKTAKSGFPGCWWEHYQEEIKPESYYDVVVELDYNVCQQDYEVRIIDLNLVQDNSNDNHSPSFNPTIIDACHDNFATNSIPVVAPKTVNQIWLKFLGIIKYLLKQNQTINQDKLLAELQISDRSLSYALNTLKYLGIEYQENNHNLSFKHLKANGNQDDYRKSLAVFLASLQQEYLQKQYFDQVPVSLIESELRS